ncbi:unnamed protein product [Brachionus calyciflorus]|uniref:Uncharacterized protein n=1 Tax=Brachionus calyciflorus TaxID=104777 RepID=A0A813Q0M3_9BILA|nr:unnamed protein product [Brachionus calyciflorus]
MVEKNQFKSTNSLTDFENKGHKIRLKKIYHLKNNEEDDDLELPDLAVPSHVPFENVNKSVITAPVYVTKYRSFPEYNYNLYQPNSVPAQIVYAMPKISNVVRLQPLFGYTPLPQSNSEKPFLINRVSPSHSPRRVSPSHTPGKVDHYQKKSSLNFTEDFDDSINKKWYH